MYIVDRDILLSQWCVYHSTNECVILAYFDDKKLAVEYADWKNTL